MQNGSRDVDTKFGNPLAPKTLVEANAPQHAMTPGAMVRKVMHERRISYDEAVPIAREMAKAEAKKFVDDAGESAKMWLRKAEQTTSPANKYTYTMKAYFEFGRGAHTLMDNVSPAHSDFQVYDAPYFDYEVDIASGLPTNAGTFTADMWAHKQAEAGEPTPAELKRSTEALHNFYRNIFGQAALDRAKGK